MQDLAPVGYYLALRVGFAFPMQEINALPADWVEYYTRERFMLFDPVIRWFYQNSGAIRWSDIDGQDQKEVMAHARRFGLRYGVSVACNDHGPNGQRSFGSFVRGDREYSCDEIDRLQRHVQELHRRHAPPTNLTDAEIEALKLVNDGLRLKQIAHVLGVTEGAVKQRLKNAKAKLGAATGAQAVSMAKAFGLFRG